MQRATKIVATIGPASSSPEILLQMMQAGLDVVRLNFSHGTADDHRQRAEMVREAARRVGRCREQTVCGIEAQGARVTQCQMRLARGQCVPNRTVERMERHAAALSFRRPAR